MRNIKVLSTKKLSSEQKEILRQVNVTLQEYNAISIEELPFKPINKIENAIVTSQNSARILIKNKVLIKKVFCVGEKTASLMQANGCKLIETSKNGTVLARFIVKNHKNDSFIFFCGNRRRSELPNILQQNQVSFTEEILYETTLNSNKFDEVFDAILFFSPSGVMSYIQENLLGNSIAFCIGSTTAAAINSETVEVIISEKSSVESVLSKLKEYWLAKNK